VHGERINDPSGKYSLLNIVLTMAQDERAMNLVPGALKLYCQDMQIPLYDPPLDFALAVKGTRLESLLISLIESARVELSQKQANVPDVVEQVREILGKDPEADLAAVALP